MRASSLSSWFSCFGAAVLAIVLLGPGTALAGDGGADAGSLQTFLDTICGNLGISTCPQLPTVTQGTLEIAGLGYARPESIRRAANIAPGSVFAGNPPPIPGNPVVPVTLPVTPQALSNLALTPLAFIAGGRGPIVSVPSGVVVIGGVAAAGQTIASPTQLYDKNANSFFYAVTTYGSVGGNPQPQSLNLFYDDLALRSQIFIKGQEVAKISLPLVVYDPNACQTNPPAGCSETEVMTILDVRATCTGGPSCLTAYAIANFSAFGKQNCSTLAQGCTAADLGLGFALVFGPSATSSFSHGIFEVQVPLIVTVANDPVHFNANFNSPQVNLIGSATFGVEDLGATLGFLPGKVFGLPTYPGPMTTGAATAFYGFCASFADNFARLNPAVAAFVAIATDGEALASTPLGESSMPALTCPL